jgi:hypothetical protein
MHVTIDKTNEPTVSARIAGHVLCHRNASCHPVKCLITARLVSLAARASQRAASAGGQMLRRRARVPVTCDDHFGAPTLKASAAPGGHRAMRT